MKSDNTAMKAVGKRIQKIRREKGYTQERFAEMVGLSTNYLSDIERGKSSARLDKLVLIMNTLGCSADEIFADVVNNGFKVKSTRISEEIEKLSPRDREIAFAILEAFVASSEK